MRITKKGRQNLFGKERSEKEITRKTIAKGQRFIRYNWKTQKVVHALTQLKQFLFGGMHDPRSYIYDS